MKKVLLIITVFILSITLVGCVPDQIDYTEQLETIASDIQTIEILEVEIPTTVIVTETEIVEIEIPVIVIETEIVEIPTTVYETKISKTLFYTADTDLIILVVSKGETSYVIEFKYEDTLLSSPMGYMIQIEKQTNGVVDDWFFMEDYSVENDVFAFEVEDWYDFADEVDMFLTELTSEELFEVMGLMYQELYDDYYNVEDDTELEV